MLERPPFIVATAALDGLNLIEASAGTGKTQALTGLYLRLVLESDIDIGQILVVTFTTAATGELRERLWRQLTAARATLLGVAPADPLTAQLLAAVPPALSRARLDRALREFDTAAIFTIHGFCQRLLAERAFESGLPFTSELLGDERELLLTIIDDRWRHTFYQATPLLINFLLDEGYRPESLLDELRSHIGRPYERYLLPVIPSDAVIDAAETGFAQAYEHLRALWQNGGRDNVPRLLREATLNSEMYRKSRLPAWMRQMDDFLRPTLPNLRLFVRLEKFSAAYLATAARTPPQHPLFSATDTLLAAHARLAGQYRELLRAFKGRLLADVREQLVLRKRRRRQQSYDDLPLNLLKALGGTHGTALACWLRERYPAALIDEFQDTDPIQYAILQRLYGATGLPVFLLGDPKQAIHSFRGADIFAYLKARHAADRCYTLAVNWRADPALLNAVNQLFTCVPQPFLLSALSYTPPQAAAPLPPLRLAGEQEPPCQFWFLASEEGAGPLSKHEAAATVARATAVEIARLLNLAVAGQALLGERPLQGGDIAVLVRSHRQGRQVRDALQAVGVPSVRQAQDNVFRTWEALELERLLLAVAEPARDTLVRAALTTDLLGLKAEDIYALSVDEPAREARLEAFYTYHQLWADAGFIRMFRILLSEEGVYRRLLAYRDGERRLTNLLHLAELLADAASRRRLGMEGLIKWLAEHRRARAADDEAYQLRLESDESRVQILTVPAAKGLEFPIVFCPYLWDGELWADTLAAVSFHDADGRATLDFGSADLPLHRQQARREELAENLRFAYVALTRARQRLYLAWGHVRGAETSPLAWLLHPPPLSVTDVQGMAEYVAGLSGERLLLDLTVLAARANGAIRVEAPPDEDVLYQPPALVAPVLEARYFPGPVAAGLRVAAQETPALRRGEQALVELLAARLAEPATAAAQLAARCAARYGLRAAWATAALARSERLLHKPLLAGTCLAALTPAQYRVGLAYRLVPGSAAQWAAVLAAQGHPAAAQAATLSLPERLHGIFDLLCEVAGRYYLVLWQPAHSAPPLLGGLLPLLALHRYLRLRLPDYAAERHLGGVYGVSLRPDDEGWHDNPSPALLAALADCTTVDKAESA